jgi:hypothetical protein
MSAVQANVEVSVVVYLRPEKPMGGEVRPLIVVLGAARPRQGCCYRSFAHLALQRLVYNLHGRGTEDSSWPAKADPPLIVDTDTRLACSVALQRFKPVAPESAQVIKARCGVEDGESLRGCPAKL